MGLGFLAWIPVVAFVVIGLIFAGVWIALLFR